MRHHFDAIARELKAAQEAAGDAGRSELLDMLDRLIVDAKGARRTVQHAQFGTQFTPADTIASEELIEPPERKFEAGERVWTPESYVGYVAGYDRKGNAVVNVVYQACEYKESDLREFT